LPASEFSEAVVRDHSRKWWNVLRPEEELRRLDGEPTPDVTVGFHVPVRVRAPDVQSVLERAREVLRVVVPLTSAELEQEAAQPSRLQGWFVRGCAPEPTPEEAAEWLAWWRSLGPVARSRAEAEKPWTLGDWLSWLAPAERQWFWWGASVDSETSATVVEVTDWPVPVWALRWLLKVAGAENVEVLEDL
jgi:hypothetical protein